MMARSPFYQKSPGVFVLPDSVQPRMRVCGRQQAHGINAYTATLRDLLNGASGTSLGIRRTRRSFACARVRARSGSST